MGQDTQSPVMFAPKFKAKAPSGGGIWTPKDRTPSSSRTNINEISGSTQSLAKQTPPPSPAQTTNAIWTPQPSPTTARKEFRPLHFESPTLTRRYIVQPEAPIALPQPPWTQAAATHNRNDSQHGNFTLSTPLQSTKLPTRLETPNGIVSSSNCDEMASSTECVAPTASVSEKIRTFERSASASELQRPVARRRPKDIPVIYRAKDVIYNVKQEYVSEPETEATRPKKMAQLERRQYDGIGPVTSDGMPIILRSEVKEPHHHEWYKRLYQTIHKQKNGDDYVIRYRCPRGRYQLKTNGYVSEPEPNYDSDYSTVKYRTLDCKRLQSTSSPTSHVKTVANHRQGDIGYGTMQNPIKAGQSSYKNQPGRIEDYVTGHSSVSDKEKKEWWDEVMDIFSGQHLDQSYHTEGNLSRALAKESGYASDSNLLLRKREDTLTNPLSPVEQKQAYKTVQAGGEPPFFGFRKTAPEKRKESPSRYVESNVNIHYKTPIRYENKEPIPENELASRQAEQMQKLYQEERRRKYLQELQDMNARRHTDNFTPSQKSPILLNRYDDFQSDLAPKSPTAAMNLKIISRALYNFQGQTARELTFRKGDMIYIRRQIDKNWYEGEHNAMVGLLPSNYVEIISTDGVRQPARSCPTVGQARAKYNFHAQSGIELSLNKGELVTLTRRVDDNWFEGKIANRKGIFPVSYVEVINDISCENPSTPKAMVSSSNTTSLHPSLDTQRTIVSSAFDAISPNDQQPPNGIRRETRNIHKTHMLHVDTSTDPKIYRAIYKYRPQNSDELELQEGDIVHVLEKCDDGWFVGTSQRTSCFGTFPGNYVERA